MTQKEQEWVDAKIGGVSLWEELGKPIIGAASASSVTTDSTRITHLYVDEGVNPPLSLCWRYALTTATLVLFGVVAAPIGLIQACCTKEKGKSIRSGNFLFMKGKKSSLRPDHLSFT